MTYYAIIREGEIKIEKYYAGFMTLWDEYQLTNLGPIKNSCCVTCIEKLYYERK